MINKPIKITHALWSGWKQFNYPKRNVPFVGIAAHKLEYAPERKVKIELAYLKDKPVVTQDSSKLIRLAKENAWEGNNQGLRVYYLPQPVLLEGYRKPAQKKETPLLDDIFEEGSKDLPF